MRCREISLIVAVLLSLGTVTQGAGSQPSGDTNPLGTPVTPSGSSAKGVDFRPLARAELDALPSTPGRFAVERLTVLPGERIEVSSPSAGEALVYVDSGEPTIIDDLGLEAAASAGLHLRLPDGVPFAVRNDTDEAAVLLTVSLAPASGAEPTEIADVGTPASGVVVDMVDIAFDPEAFSIPANTDVEVTLTNSGAALHDFTIEELDINEVVDPGAETTITINAATGEYEYVCTQPGHLEAGMAGVMTVVGENPTATPPPDSSAAEPASGVLFETAIASLPDPPAILFLEEVIFAPGSELASLGEVGPIGFYAVAGDLTIERPERLPGRLPEGRGVAFPTGSDIRVRNAGAEPVVAIVAGVMRAGADIGSASSAASPASMMPTSRAEPILPRTPTAAPPTTTPEPPTLPSSAPTATAESVAEGEPVTVTGTGTMVSNRFRLAAGRYKVTARLQVEEFSGFIAVIHGNEDWSDLLFNELIEDTGTWTASTVVEVESSGSYFVEVSNTDAPWSLRFEEF